MPLPVLLGGALLSSGTREFGFPAIPELLSVFLDFPGNTGTGTQNTPPRLHRRYSMRVVWFGAGACLAVVLFECI